MWGGLLWRRLMWGGLLWRRLMWGGLAFTLASARMRWLGRDRRQRLRR
jgi:hypothetical protein